MFDEHHFFVLVFQIVLYDVQELTMPIEPL